MTLADGTVSKILNLKWVRLHLSAEKQTSACSFHNWGLGKVSPFQIVSVQASFTLKACLQPHGFILVSPSPILQTTQLGPYHKAGKVPCYVTLILLL